MRFPKLFSLVAIDWVDATTMNSAWGSFEDWEKKLDEAPAGLLCTSIGFLIRVDRDRIVIVQSYNSFGHFADGLSIPIGCIKNVTVLAEKKGRTKKDEPLIHPSKNWTEGANDDDDRLQGRELEPIRNDGSPR